MWYTSAWKLLKDGKKPLVREKFDFHWTGLGPAWCCYSVVSSTSSLCRMLPLKTHSNSSVDQSPTPQATPTNEGALHRDPLKTNSA